MWTGSEWQCPDLQDVVEEVVDVVDVVDARHDGGYTAGC